MTMRLVPVQQWAAYLHWLDDCESGYELMLVLDAV